MVLYFTNCITLLLHYFNSIYYILLFYIGWICYQHRVLFTRILVARSTVDTGTHWIQLVTVPVGICHRIDLVADLRPNWYNNKEIGMSNCRDANSFCLLYKYYPIQYLFQAGRLPLKSPPWRGKRNAWPGRVAGSAWRLTGTSILPDSCVRLRRCRPPRDEWFHPREASIPSIWPTSCGRCRSRIVAR